MRNKNDYFFAVGVCISHESPCTIKFLLVQCGILMCAKQKAGVFDKHLNPRVTQKRVSNSLPVDLPWWRRSHEAPGSLGLGQAGRSWSPEKPDITGRGQQRFRSCFRTKYPRCRAEELPRASSLGTVLLCHTIWTILLLSLVICCSTISCSGDFPCASRFLYKKKTKTFPRKYLFATWGVWFPSAESLLPLVEGSSHPIKVNHHVHLGALCQRQFCKISSS